MGSGAFHKARKNIDELNNFVLMPLFDTLWVYNGGRKAAWF